MPWHPIIARLFEIFIFPFQNIFHSSPTSMSIRCNLDEIFDVAEPKHSTASQSKATTADHLPSEQDGVLIWYTDINQFRDEDDQVWKASLKSLSTAEQAKVLKFAFFDDRKRCLLSTFLQKSLIRTHLQCARDDEFKIERTRENKPYATSPKKALGSWNYNVSHHGNYVCIASHSKYIVGVDLVDLETRSLAVGRADDYIDIFSKQLGVDEVRGIRNEPTENAKYAHFFVLWSLKEAFIKAIGLGLGFDLQNATFKVTFHHDGSDSIDLSIDPIEGEREARCRGCTSWSKGSAVAYIFGKKREDWRFNFFKVDEKHVMTIALGPLGDVIESYRAAAWGAKSAIKEKRSLGSMQAPQESMCVDDTSGAKGRDTNGGVLGGEGDSHPEKKGSGFAWKYLHPETITHEPPNDLLPGVELKTIRDLINPAHLPELNVLLEASVFQN